MIQIDGEIYHVLGLEESRSSFIFTFFFSCLIVLMKIEPQDATVTKNDRE